MKKNTKQHTNTTVKCVENTPNTPNTPNRKDVVCHEWTISRAYFIEVYCEPCRWAKALAECEHYAWILHDKDVKEDGTPKAKHYHIAIYFKNARRWTAVKDMFDVSGLTEDTTILGQIPLKTVKECALYLVHANDNNKYKYPLAEVNTDSLNWWYGKDGIAQEKDLNLLDDLMNGNKTYFEMAQSYGRDYMLNFRRYADFAQQAHLELAKQQRQLEVEQFLQNCVDGEKVTLEESYMLADIIPHLIYSMAKCRTGYNSNSEQSIRLTVRELMFKVFALANEMGDML